MDFSVDFSTGTIVTFLTLFVLEIVLGVDNIVFISILAGTLPPEMQAEARNLGLTLGMFMRVVLVFAAVDHDADQAVVHRLGHEFSGRDLILIVGGLFLVVKAVRDPRQARRVEEHGSERRRRAPSPRVVQIMVVDIVFSLDSVITAVGMVDDVSLMIIAAN